MNSNMTTNRTVCKIWQSILYLTFLSSEFIEIVLMTFANIVFAIFFSIVFVTFVDTLSVAFIISLHTLTKVSALLFKSLPLSQIHVLGFQL